MNHELGPLHVLKQAKELSKHAGFWDLYLLGLTIVLGGQFFSWNAGLHGGFWELFTSTVLTGTAYLCLVLCLAEMTSALPFSGGAYGFVRVAVGPFWGFIVALCEVLQNVFYVTATVMPLGQMLTFALNTPKSFEPVYWILFFVTSIYINISGQQLFWRTNFVLGVLSLLLLVIYILGSFKFVDFDAWATKDVEGSQDQEFDSWNWIKHMPLSAWFYIGVEMLPLAAKESHCVKRNLPLAMVSCMCTLFVTSFFVLFTAASQDPGTAGVASELLPLNAGFAKLFGVSARHAVWFSLPATYATGFGFMFAYGRQIASMADSGLFPNILRFRTEQGKPYAALVIGSVVSLVTTFGIYFSDRSFVEDLFFWSISSSYVVYLFALLSFLAFRKKYSGISRSFTNPLGVYSVYYGGAVFLMSLISTLGFQGHSMAHRMHPFSGFLIFLAIGYLYYYCIARSRQRFSEEEQKIMFSAYVINSNMRGKHKLKARRNSAMNLKDHHHHLASPMAVKGFFTRQWSRYTVSNKSTASCTTSTANQLDSIADAYVDADVDSDSTKRIGVVNRARSVRHEDMTKKTFVEGHRQLSQISGKDSMRIVGCFPSLISEESFSIAEIPLDHDLKDASQPIGEEYSLAGEHCADNDLEAGRGGGSVKSMVNNFVGMAAVSSGSGDELAPQTLDSGVAVGRVPSVDHTRHSLVPVTSSSNSSRTNVNKFRLSSFIANAFSFDEGDGPAPPKRQRSGVERLSMSEKFATRLQQFALHKILPIVDDPEFYSMEEQVIMEHSQSDSMMAIPEVDVTTASDGCCLHPEEDYSSLKL